MGCARIALGAMLLGVCAWGAQASTFLLEEAGWQITGANANELGITVDTVDVDANGRKFVVIEISKEFVFGPDPQTQVIPSIVLAFTQIAEDADTATRIFIADETVTNSTGVDWYDYHWILMRHGVATFNRELTAVGDGFRVDPFKQAQWHANPNLDNEQLNVWDGKLNAGGVFFPGSGPGNLVIDVDTSPSRWVSFSFKQLPTYIPEPASAALLLFGAAAWLRKRRR